MVALGYRFIYVFALETWIGPMLSIHSLCDRRTNTGVRSRIVVGLSHDYVLGRHWCVRPATSFVFFLQ
jgi:hypothetical protein